MNNRRFIVRAGSKVRLKDYDPGFTGEFADAAGARADMAAAAAELAKYQDILLAHETYAVLMIFQAMDGAGKDGAIKHVMSNADPQGCKVSMFEKPTREELKHDYLWRYAKALPGKGQIGIFNRSYYEQIVTERVHPERLEEWRLPASARGRGVWPRRAREINNFEQYLAANGVVLLKFFLNLSKEKQRERLLERTRLPEKKWKFSMSDIEDRGRWDEYTRAYEWALSRTGTRAAPWHVIPADNRWFTHAAVASVTVARLKSLHSRYPTAGRELKGELGKAAKILGRE